ncbi:MAG: CBS domain-containing protein [Candidatus Thorarchaeota archaeon]|nr:CBS domain-containing protein [Candidatus Thorarchaeota archaeon]
MKVVDCMQSDVVHISVPGTREDVLRIMAEKQINGLPVVKKGTKHLVGIVTRTDLLRKADEDQIAMLMVRDPTTVTPDTDIITAAKIMFENSYRRLPVVDKNELVGLVSVPDILGVLLEDSEKFNQMQIRDYIKRQIVSVWDRTPLPLAYMILDMAGQNALVVLDDAGGVTGMITASDFIRLSEETIEDNISTTFSGTENAVDWGWTSKEFLVVTRKLLKLPAVEVGQVTTKKIINVTEVTSVSECVKILRKYDIDQAPVLSAAGNLIGMIEDRNLLKLAIGL